jgi:hypothetical protein
MEVEIASEEQVEITMEDVSDDDSTGNETQPQTRTTKKRKQSELGDTPEPLLNEAEGMVCFEEWDQVNFLLGLARTNRQESDKLPQKQLLLLQLH